MSNIEQRRLDASNPSTWTDLEEQTIRNTLAATEPGGAVVAVFGENFNRELLKDGLRFRDGARQAQAYYHAAPDDIKAILTRRDCGPVEFARMKEYFRHAPHLVGCEQFAEWLTAHRDAVMEWNKNAPTGILAGESGEAARGA